MEVHNITDERKDSKKLSVKEKIKKIKHLDIIIAILVITISIAIYLSVTYDKKDVMITKDTNEQFVHELEDVLSSIDGVGKVKIMINYDDNKIVEIATKEESVSRVDKDGTISVIESNKEPIIIRGNGEDKPIVLHEISDSIKGVVVVCKGGDDVRVKMSLIDALSTLLKIDGNKIKIYPMK